MQPFAGCPLQARRGTEASRHQFRFNLRPADCEGLTRTATDVLLRLEEGILK